MSASFMARYGSSDGLTPRLDSLCGKALVFDRSSPRATARYADWKP